MKNILFKFSLSFREFKDLRSITGMGILLAFSIVLSFFTVPLALDNRISLTFLATALLGMLYGPAAGALAAGMGDILAYMLKPTGPYFFGFTLTAMVSAFIYGLFFYKANNFIIPRAIASKIIVTLFSNCILNTFWLTMLYGNKSFIALLLIRLPKNLIVLPIEIILLYMVVLAVQKLLINGRVRVSH